MGTGNGLVDVLQAGLRAAGMRQAVIAGNIANSNTPGYRRQAVQFEDLLTEALDRGGRVDLDAVVPQIVHPHDTPVRGNGNDVDMEMEIGELVKNASRYKVYLRLLARVYRQAELAVGQP